jgi:hypothetical protein
MDSISRLSKPRRHSQVRYTRVPEGALVVLHEKGELKTLNPVGALILDLLDGDHTVDAIVERVIKEYDVAPPEAEADTLAFLEELRRHDIIEAG